MATHYKQSYILVMENGKIIKWAGKAEDKNHGEGLAVEYAQEKTGQQVWNMCSRPAH